MLCIVYAYDLLKMVTFINECEEALHSAFDKNVGETSARK
jgi:hypothetical protein